MKNNIIEKTIVLYTNFILGIYSQNNKFTYMYIAPMKGKVMVLNQFRWKALSYELVYLQAAQGGEFVCVKI